MLQSAKLKAVIEQVLKLIVQLFGVFNYEMSNIFKSVQKTCTENRVREFHLKFTHRIVVTKKEFFRFNIKSDSNCIYCGDLDSIDHTFLECQITKSFTQDVLQWFNTENDSEFKVTSNLRGATLADFFWQENES